MAKPNPKPADTMPTPKAALSADQLRNVQLMADRIRQGQQRLGALDLERSVLEQQSVQLRAQVMRDRSEMEGVVQGAAKAFGLSESGWQFNLDTGEFAPR